MNRTLRILSAFGLTLALGATLPSCVVRGRGTLATSGTTVVAYDAPPAPRPENPQPMSGHVWVAGNWSMQNGSWVWIDGHWERERAGQAWQQGRWEPHNGSWHWVEGTWSTSSSPGGTIVTGDGAVIVDGNNGNGGGRPRHQDHRDEGQPPLVATGGAGTVVVGNGQVTVTGPRQAPPPLRVESPGPARRGYLWIEGEWQYTNGQYEWVAGHWERTKANMSWTPTRWEPRGGVYVRIEGHWGS